MSYYGSINDHVFHIAIQKSDKEKRANYESCSSVLHKLTFSCISLVGWFLLAVSIFAIVVVKTYPSMMKIPLTLLSDSLKVVTTHPNENLLCHFSEVARRKGVFYILPSEYEACLRRIGLDANNTIQTIRALDQIFEQEYVFYSVAKNPTSLFSGETATHFNFTVYDIRVDIHHSLLEIEQKIKANNKADVSIFWDVNEVFRSLRDAHVAALQGNLGSLSSDFFSGRFALEIIPEKWLLGNQDERLRVGFSYQNGTELRMLIEWLQPSSSYQKGKVIRRRTVSKIDNVTTVDFVLKLARSQMLSTNLKSIGPRVNALATFHFPTNFKGDHAFFWTGRGARKEQIHPNNITPDFFWIEYDDKTREKVLARIIIHDDELKGFRYSKSSNSLKVHLSEVQQQVNEPSCLYQHFSLGTQPLNETAVDRAKLNRERLRSNQITTSFGQRERRRLSVLHDTCEVSTHGWFTKSYNCSGFPVPYNDDGPLEAAYRVMDGYMLFKLDSFDAPPGLFMSIWKEMYLSAQEAGINALMIDISNNGGGEVPAGLDLARLMYPEVPCYIFENNYDIIYNEPMRLWAALVRPLLSELSSQWGNSGQSDENLLLLLRSLTKRKRKSMKNIAEAMCILDLDHSEDYCGNVDAVKKNCTLLAVASSFQENPSLHRLRAFLENLISVLSQSNPWTMTTDYGVDMNIELVSYNLSGVATNFSGFLGHEPDVPWWDCSAMQEQDLSFSEYILVGNGNSGSTANTFQSTVEQIWKNRHLSGAMRPLTTVSYGGVPGDTPLTQYAGGTVADRVNTEDAYVGLLGLRLLSILLNNTDYQPQIEKAIFLLQQSLPNVPFYLQQFSRMTAVQIHNFFIYPEYVPLEYVKILPDAYIPEMYFGSIFDHPEGLNPLYDIASQYFRKYEEV